jgi:hypothetical protein
MTILLLSAPHRSIAFRIIRGAVRLWCRSHLSEKALTGRAAIASSRASTGQRAALPDSTSRLLCVHEGGAKWIPRSAVNALNDAFAAADEGIGPTKTAVAEQIHIRGAKKENT